MESELTTLIFEAAIEYWVQLVLGAFVVSLAYLVSYYVRTERGKVMEKIEAVDERVLVVLGKTKAIEVDNSNIKRSILDRVLKEELERRLQELGSGIRETLEHLDQRIDESRDRTLDKIQSLDDKIGLMHNMLDSMNNHLININNNNKRE